MLRKLVFHHLVMRLIMPIWTLVPNFQVEYNTFFLDQDIPLLHGVTNVDLATQSAIFLVSNIGTFGKSGHFRTKKNGTSSGQIKILRPLLQFKHSQNMVPMTFIL